MPLQALIISPQGSYQITRPSMKIIHLRYIPWPSSALPLACVKLGAFEFPLHIGAQLFSCLRFSEAPS
jgi:hypothetical protein